MNIPDNSLGSMTRLFREELQASYTEGEIQSLISWSFEHRIGLKGASLILAREQRLSESDILFFQDVIQRLQAQEPIQYILGETEFYGLTIQTDSRALIPRPETEELVDWIREAYPIAPPQHILDIGTGTGCIPLALRSLFPKAQITTVDRSKDALELANANSLNLNLPIAFEELDFLQAGAWRTDEAWDLVVSNPPYVTEGERKSLSQRVADHEPDSALFVPTEDPLLFYDAILNWVKQVHSRVWVYFEVHYQFGPEVVRLAERLGFEHADLKKDLNGRNRMVRCAWQP